MVQALLMALLALLNGTQGPTFWYLFREPLMAGFWVGLIYGNPVQGVIIGATIDVSYMGWISAGGANASDLYWAGLLGTFVVLSGGMNPSMSASVAVPIGFIGNYMHVAYMTIASAWPAVMDGKAEKGNWRAIRRIQVLGGPAIVCLVRVLPIFLIALFGAEYINTLANSLPLWVINGLTAVGKTLPALGMAMLWKFMWKKDLAVFFILGFIIAGYLGINDLLFFALFGVCMAVVLMSLGYGSKEAA